MKRVFTILLVAMPMCCPAHPCPYDWNVTFAGQTKISGKNVADFARQFNDAVRKRTNGAVKTAIVVETRPDTFTKVPADSEFAGQMDALMQRYREITAPLLKEGVWEYGAAPLEIEFPADFPVACILSGHFDRGAITSNETKDGLIVTIQRKLECRIYRLSDSFLKIVDERKRQEPAPGARSFVQDFFAGGSDMMRELAVYKGPENFETTSIIDGVTLYIPDRKVMLALETKEGHEQMTELLKKHGYIEGSDWKNWTVQGGVLTLDLAEPNGGPPRLRLAWQSNDPFSNAALESASKIQELGKLLAVMAKFEDWNQLEGACISVPWCGDQFIFKRDGVTWRKDASSLDINWNMASEVAEAIGELQKRINPTDTKREPAVTPSEPEVNHN